MKGFLVFVCTGVSAWGSNYEDDYDDYGNDDYGDYQSPSQYDSGGYDSQNGNNQNRNNQNQNQGRIADIPPSKNPTLLLERILRDYDPQIRPNDKVNF